MKAVYLYPKSSFVTELSSDTLWGLLVVAIGYVLSEKDLVETIDKYLKNEPPFIVSSAFPFKKNSDGSIVHFLPSVFFRPNMFDDFNVSKKELKSIAFFSKEIFEQIINGEVAEKELERFFADPVNKQRNTFQFNLVSNLHTTIDPLTGTTLELDGSGQLYYSREYYLHRENEGLFFLVDGKELHFVEPALRFLSHFGFGGDHSTGKGTFSFEIRDFSLKVPENPTSFLTLSLYNPNEDELAFFKSKSDNFLYRLVMRKGIVGAQFKRKGYEKKPFFAFAEGSRFPIGLEKQYFGRLLKTMDDPQAFSYAFAFPIPARFKE